MEWVFGLLALVALVFLARIALAVIAAMLWFFVDRLMGAVGAIRHFRQSCQQSEAKCSAASRGRA